MLMLKKLCIVQVSALSYILIEILKNDKCYYLLIGLTNKIILVDDSWLNWQYLPNLEFNMFNWIKISYAFGK